MENGKCLIIGGTRHEIEPLAESGRQRCLLEKRTSCSSARHVCFQVSFRLLQFDDEAPDKCFLQGLVGVHCSVQGLQN